MERRLEEGKWAQSEGGNKVLLQSAEEMLKNEGEGEQRGRRVLGSGEVISTEWITLFLRKGNEREVLGIPSGVEVPSLAGRNMMYV